MQPTTTREKLSYLSGMVFVLLAAGVFVAGIRTGAFRYLAGGAVALSIGSYLLSSALRGDDAEDQSAHGR